MPPVSAAVGQLVIATITAGDWCSFAGMPQEKKTIVYDLEAAASQGGQGFATGLDDIAVLIAGPTSPICADKVSDLWISGLGMVAGRKGPLK